jgi:hypothetical protein
VTAPASTVRGVAYAAAEVYASKSAQCDLGSLAAQARSIAAEVPGGAAYAGSVLLATDEICLHLFAGPDLAALTRACEAAGVRAARVLEVTTIDRGPCGPRPPGAAT